jgi:hypothetical protein
MGREWMYKGRYGYERPSMLEARSPRTSADGARRKGRGDTNKLRTRTRAGRAS